MTRWMEEVCKHNLDYACSQLELTLTDSVSLRFLQSDTLRLDKVNDPQLSLA